MSIWRSHNFIYFAILVYALLWLLLHPVMGYLLDSDAVAYLTIAKRAAAGDWANSVNGLWSPLNSWLLVPFINWGVNPWLAAKVLNFFLAGVVLVQAYFLFGRLAYENWIRNILVSVLVIVLCFYSYYQMFGDVLQLIFALGYVNLFVQQDFVLSTKKVMLAALIMGIGFYAKSYSLVFFIMHFSALCLLVWSRTTAFRRKVAINYFFGIFISILVVLPWSFQLQKKYGEFSLTGFAGKLNMSWYINSGKTFANDIRLLIPPSYHDSPSFWEDPYLSQGQLSTPVSSLQHFGRWVLRVGHTVLMAIKSALEISIFYLPIVFLLLYRLYKKRKVPEPLLPILLAVLILPLGYLAMHIETRYIWLNTFLIMILGVSLIRGYALVAKPKSSILVFALSFLLVIVFIEMPKMVNKNKTLFELASCLKKKDVQGKIVTNKNDEGSFWVVSYLAQLQNYTIEQNDFELTELVSEMKRYGIKNYMHFADEGGPLQRDTAAFNLYFMQKKIACKQATLYQLRD